MYPLEKTTKNFQKVFEIAGLTAATLNTQFIGSEHFIYAFLSVPECEAHKILVAQGVGKDEYGALFVKSVDKSYTTPGMTPRTRQVYDKAGEAAERDGLTLGTAHMLQQILNIECVGVQFLRKFADIEKLKEETKRALHVVKMKKEWGEPTEEESTAYSSFGGGSASLDEAISQLEEIESPSVMTEERKDTKGKRKYSRKESDKLEGCGIDMTMRAKKGKMDPVIGRQKEIEKVVQVLSRRMKNNPVLVGEPGVGKSAIIEGLSQLIVKNEVPEQLYNKRVFSVDLPGMLAGTRYRGDFEEKLKNLLETVMDDGDIVLFIDEIHTLVGAGSSSEGSMDAANILKPLLARGDLQVIGATTIEEYRKYIEKDSALERRFTPVFVEEPSEKDTVEIIRGLRSKYEEHHEIAITDEAIEAAVQLSSRYITDRFLPDKAIDLIDEAAARVRIVENGGSIELQDIQKEIAILKEEEEMHVQCGKPALAMEARKQRMYAEDKKHALEMAQKPRYIDGRPAICREHVAAIVSARVRIPLLKITQEEGEKLMRLEEDLHRRIIGQNEAVNAVSKAIRRARAGLKDPSRPIGSFIFVGPTGVGKTDLCKALAEALFGSEEQMIRLDMSEYMEKQSISKLIGAPPGYVGYEDLQTGQLTEKVRTKPYCVILFDEIEKAHPDVFNLLLQILDDGRLTDSKGKTVSFKNAVIILTSNVGAQIAESERTGVYGFGGSGREDHGADERQYEGMRENITKALKEKFRPEFLNRMDDIIVFHRLTETDCVKIGRKIVEGLAKRLLEQRGIVLTVAEVALATLVKEGYDPQYGARPLKRVIQKRIEDRLSEEILLGKIRNGQHVTIDVQAGMLTFITKSV